jgi:hypothetical protein
LQDVVGAGVDEWRKLVFPKIKMPGDPQQAPDERRCSLQRSASVSHGKEPGRDDDAQDRVFAELWLIGAIDVAEAQFSRLTAHQAASGRIHENCATAIIINPANAG